MVVWLTLVGCPRSNPELLVDDALSEAPAALADDAVLGIDTPILRSLVADYWAATMSRYPQWANELGDSRYAGELYDASPEALKAWNGRLRDWVVRLAAIPDEVLSERDQLTRDLLLRDLRTSLASRACRFETWGLSARWNALVGANSLGENPRLETEADARALLARYQKSSAGIRQDTANLKRGLAEGRVGIAASMKLVVDMLDGQLGLAVTDWPMALPINDAPEFDGRAAWAAEILEALEEGIRPALLEQRAFIANELVPAGRSGENVGLHALPDGDACYAAQIETHTTLSKTADELHNLGLAELSSIHAEFRMLGANLLGTDDLATIFDRLRTDPALRFETAEQVLQTAEDALARARDAIPRYFGRLPQAECTVEPVPDYIAPHTTIAYYQPPRPDGSRPGIYYVNAYQPETRPRYEAEVLAFHESIPGHHLQIAIGQELEELPTFRRIAGYTAFVEGWALYTERLSDEMGLYTSDTDRIGMLSFDAWRASRLVVDTGLHAKGWSRKQAEDFMATNTPLALNNIANEVDRYINTPGQALAYKVGQIEVLRMRDAAREQLGDDFSYPEFHDQLLAAGALPLPILGERIERWLDRDAAN